MPPPPVRRRSSAGPADDEIVWTHDLTKVYRAGVTAVDRVSVAVRRGDIFGLLGPNGAGKTTTIGMLTTRIVPTQGEVFVGGVDVVAEPARARQLLGVVSQGTRWTRGCRLATT